MSRGPLPDPSARRRNSPTIPGTVLPADGRKGRAPKCPYELGAAGKAWWKWAWSSPQATKWDDGALFTLARRAQLEDLAVALEAVAEFDLVELLEGDDLEEASRRLRWLLGKLKAAAGGQVGVMREMRELDNRFGLNAKAMADLRWTVGNPEQGAGAAKPPAAGAARKLRAV